MFCTTCGATLHPAARRCGRCGADLNTTQNASSEDGQKEAAGAQFATAAEVEVTIDRSRLPGAAEVPPADAAIPVLPAAAADAPQAPVPTPILPFAGADTAQSAAAASIAPPPPVTPIALLSQRAPVGRPPAEVTVVSVTMLLLAALLAYPVLRYGFPLLPSLFAHTAFERAFAALFLFLFVVVAACAAALVVLAVGMLRGSRVAQALTMLLDAAIAIGVLVNGQTAARGTQTHDVLTVIIVLVCLAVLALLALPASTRSFFAQDPSPVGVWATATACVYFGWCISIAGLMLAIAGTLQVKFVWWGVAFVLIGACLTTLSRPLRAGRDWARIVASLALVGYVAAGWVFAGSNGDSGATSTVIQTVIGLGAVGLLWLLPSSTRHFALGPHPVRPRLAVQPIGWLALGVLTAVLAGVGLSANASHTTAATSLNDYVPPSNDQAFLSASPTVTAGPTVAAGSLDRSWTVQDTAPGGYAETVMLSVGTPQHLQPGLAQGQLLAGSACSIDPSTDAVIPAELVETNTTSGFAAYTASSFGFGYQWDSPAVEVRFADGPQCESDGYNDHSTSKLQPEMRTVSEMFFVLHGYFTPDHPDGDPAVLATATVAFGPASVSPDDGSPPIQYTPSTPTGSPTAEDGSIPLGGDSSTGSSSDFASPSDSATPGQLPGDLTQQVGPVDDGDCAGHTTGRLAKFLDAGGCTSMKRSLYTMTVDGRQAVIAVADLFLANPADVTPFAELSTQNGTGDVLTLIHDGDNFIDGPASFTDDPTYLAQAGAAGGEVVVLQAMWNDGSPTHADDPALAPVLAQIASSVQ